MFSGHMLIQYGFGVMHDASHHAISSNPKVNEWLSRMWTSIALWDNSIWYKHHCFMHHAYTGSEHDPDVIHYYPLIRKSPAENGSRYIGKISGTFSSMLFLLNVFPGMWFGQSLAYIKGLCQGFMWRFKLPRRSDVGEIETTIKLLVVVSFVYAWYSGGILIPILYTISANFWYSVCILGDHDTFETEQNLVRDMTQTDWGECQVRNSGNFSTDNPYTVNIFGGINYQIEHHLFPTICHVHLPEVAKIVKATCDEFGVPYVSHPTIVSAYSSAIKKFIYIVRGNDLRQTIHSSDETTVIPDIPESIDCSNTSDDASQRPTTLRHRNPTDQETSSGNTQ